MNHIPVCVRIRGTLERSLEEETELASLYRVGTQDHLYVLTVHKFICDRESALVLSKEVAANYAAIVADRPLPSPTAQYRHYLQSQEGYLRGSA